MHSLMKASCKENLAVISEGGAIVFKILTWTCKFSQS